MTEPGRGGPQVVILTGVSGSGKSTALRALEDAGFYCVDNLPIVFLEKLLELSGHTAGEVSRIALVVDAREGRFLAEAPRIIQQIRQEGADVEVLFLDAEIPMLIVPVRPGRNMTTIVEVAARNHLLKLQGHHSAREFQERLNRAIALAPGARVVGEDVE